MSTKLETFNQTQLKKDLPDIRPGDTIKVYQIISAVLKTKANQKENKQDQAADQQKRIQVFEGQVIAKKHGRGVSSSLTVRKVTSGIGIEKTFPLHSRVIDKIEIVKKGKAKKAKLYYLRKAKGKRAKLKREEVVA